MQVFQKGYGGSGKDKKINISTPSQPPAAPQPPSQPVTWNVNAGYSGNGRVEPGKGGHVVGSIKFTKNL